MSTKPRLVRDPTQPEVYNHQTLVSDFATNPKIIAACAHYGLPCEKNNIALARARLAIHFMGAGQPDGEPRWLTDFSGLFERQRYKVHDSVKIWAAACFGERWEPGSTVAWSVAGAARTVLESNGVAFDYKGHPFPERAPKLPDEPPFNIIDCFSDLLQRDLSAHRVMGKKDYANRQKTDWVETHYTAPALAALGVRAGGVLYKQEEARLRTAFKPQMILKKDYLWIAQHLDYDRVEVSRKKKSGKTARFLPWGVVIAGPKVSLPIDLLVAFTVSRSVSLAALKGKGRVSEDASAQRHDPREAARATKRQRPLEIHDEPLPPARRRRYVVDDGDDDDDDGDDDDGRANDNGSDDDDDDEPIPPARRRRRRVVDVDDDDDGQPAAPATLVEAFLSTYQVRQLLHNPNPSKLRPGVSRARAKKSPHEVKTMLTGPRTTAFTDFVHSRCTGYSTKYPLGLRYHRDGGPAFDPNEYTGRPHPAVSTDLCFKQTEGEKEKLQRPASASE